MSKIDLVQGDITTLSVDAIVNAANETLLGGGGVDGAIHKAAGQQLLDECRALGGCLTGDAKITKGYNLNAKHVIHTVGPIWAGGKQRERELLDSCYLKSLMLAYQNGLKSIAFPCVSTGVYNFPKQDAAQIAIKAVKLFLQNHQDFEKVIFCVFSSEDHLIYQSILN